jgi:hypothetical protein
VVFWYFNLNLKAVYRGLVHNEELVSLLDWTALKELITIAWPALREVGVVFQMKAQ